MAERRMFAKTIIDSDAFLDMPLSTQSLYFHLSMCGDDEGFVNNPKKIQRMIGASDDDMKILIAKNFIIAFETGVIVIKHWKIHNYIRGDRLQPTVYAEERATLEVKDNGVYTLSANAPIGIPVGGQVTDICQSTDSQVSAQVSIGKVSIDKISIDNKRASVNADFEYLWSLYPKKRGKQAALKAYEAAVKRGTTKEEVEKGIKAYIASINANRTESRYIKHGDTFFRGAHWQDEYDITGVNNNDGIYNQYGGISNSGTDWRSIDEPNII